MKRFSPDSLWAGSFRMAPIHKAWGARVSLWVITEEVDVVWSKGVMNGSFSWHTDLKGNY